MAVSVGLIEQLIEETAPKAWAESWDNPGLLVGDGKQEVGAILVALDGVPAVVDEAAALGAELIVAHHPLLFQPLRNLRADNPAAQVPLSLCRRGIAYLAAHTNLDQSPLSASLAFGRALALTETDFLETTGTDDLFKIVVYVPPAQAENLRRALAAAGVGAGTTSGPHSDAYAECFFQTEGEGMFRPLPGATPYSGRVGDLTRVPETRLESVTAAKNLKRALRALRRSHPYEEPAYDVIPLANEGKRRGYGLFGRLPETVPLRVARDNFLAALSAPDAALWAQRYDLSAIRWFGPPDHPVRRVAVSNGGGNSLAAKARRRGADLFITGELDYHQRLDCLTQGTAVAEMGHFLSEAPMLTALADYLRGRRELAGVTVTVSRQEF
ncbi:MAG: Nif3-like dinuclear metal center hexameric protein [Gracilibacteraceae bacterium]|jgi:dinuclear metal center YbgI/SA1388 family protein|nr:Nif3-like dinuclear metal center hexameric protein [Gracilibacteraceae bacterium]